MVTGIASAQSTPPQATSFLATGTYRLTVTERELSLDAREASLTAILTEIEQRTKIPIVMMYSGVDERITIHLSPMPLDKALKQLSPNVAIATARGPNAPPLGRFNLRSTRRNTDVSRVEDRRCTRASCG